MSAPRTVVRVYFGWTSKPLVATSLQEALVAIGGDGLTRGVTRIEYETWLPPGSQNRYVVTADGVLVADVTTRRHGLTAVTCGSSHYQLHELDVALHLATTCRWLRSLRPSRQRQVVAARPELAALLS